MADPINNTLTWARDIQKFAAESLAAFGTRLATWLILGNAGALVLAFNSLLAGQTCDSALLRTVTGLFAVGLLSAFLAASITYFTATLALHHLTKTVTALSNVSNNQYYIADLEGGGIVVPDDAPLRQGIEKAGADIAAAQRATPWIYGALFASFIVFGVSAVSFATAVLLPVFDANGFATCPAATIPPPSVAADALTTR